MTIHYLKPEFESENPPLRNPIPDIDPPEGFLGTWTRPAPYFILIRPKETDADSYYPS